MDLNTPSYLGIHKLKITTYLLLNYLARQGFNSLSTGFGSYRKYVKEHFHLLIKKMLNYHSYELIGTNINISSVLGVNITMQTKNNCISYYHILIAPI